MPESLTVTLNAEDINDKPQFAAFAVEDDPSEVTWDGPDDPANPRNWSKGKKWSRTMQVGLIGIIGPMASSIVGPAVPLISKDFRVTSSVSQEMILSIFVLAFALGPLFFGPLSEIYGRRWVILIPAMCFLGFNIACTYSTNLTEMLIFRFLAGVGGSAPLSVGAGVLSDIFKPEEIGPGMIIFSLAPLLGPVLGPIIAAFLVERYNWQWTFHALSMIGGIVIVLSLFLLTETYAPRILAVKAAKIGKKPPSSLHGSVSIVLSESIKRPFILLFTQPIVQVVALYMAYIYGLMYLVLATFSKLWIVRYHQAVGISGLHFISLGLGMFVGSLGSAPFMQKIYLRLRDQNDGVGEPEFRLPVAIPFAFVLPISLFLYGWSAQNTLHWILPDLGIFLFGMSFSVPFLIITIYLVDAYRRYSASAMAAASVLRSIFGFAFPLFATTMYDSLDYGWGNSVLGFVAIVGIPAPLLVYRYGAYFREKSTYAAG
ncbi:major facilitator superfamily domain-containing protein [Zopfochytrium polystomum]|nr:major facilitator superfamily domain-containing protein [Zopfochytrium polystomum]